MNNIAFQTKLALLEKMNKKYGLATDEMLEVAHLDFQTFNPYEQAFERVTVEVTNEAHEVTRTCTILKIDARAYQVAETDAKELLFGLI